MNETRSDESSGVAPVARRGSAFRVAIVLAALLLAGLAVQEAVSRARAAREIEVLLKETGAGRRQPEVAEYMRRDPDAARGRLGVARALLVESFDQRIFSRLPQREAIEEASRVGERLELARSLAEAAYRERPAAWEAPMIMGAATYRLWSMRGDPRLFTERETWEKPLLTAMALAPAEDEPPRLLAWARLELWPGLPREEQEATRPLLRRAFAEQATFDRLAASWLAAAGSREEAFALVPDTPGAWAVVWRLYAGGLDWNGYCLARARWKAALRRDLEGRLEEVGRQVRGGAGASARGLALSILSAAPPDEAYRDVVERALTLLPAGPTPPDGFPGARSWLTWALDGTSTGSARLSAAAIARLALASGDLPPATRALAELVAGDLAAAELIERRREDTNTEAWAPYFLAKASAFARRGDVVGARQALASVHRSWRGAPSEVEVRVGVAEASRDPEAIAAARVARAAASRDSWPATSWRWRGPVTRLELLPGAAASGAEIAVDVAPEKGAVVEISIDGRSMEPTPAWPSRTLRLLLPVSPRPHLVEVTSLAGGRVVPGVLSLIPQAS